MARRCGDLSVHEVATYFGVAEEAVRRWMRQAVIDDGVRDGQISSEGAELVSLRRDKSRLEMENEILRGARLLHPGLLHLAGPTGHRSRLARPPHDPHTTPTRSTP